jgi:Esterase-like activity of phytase
VTLRPVVMTALALLMLLVPIMHATPPPAGPTIIAIGSISGLYEDFATPTAGLLENGVPGNRLGGLGSGLAYAGGHVFIGLPDRGPNAVKYNSCVDDTVSYINRFQTLHMTLAPVAPADPPSPLPFTLTPMLIGTTLLSSPTPLVYGSAIPSNPNCVVDAGAASPVVAGPLGSGVPALNAAHHTYYFTGRSDNFDAGFPSTNPRDARLDTESVRVSNDGLSVFISDEYGPYVYQFERFTGRRIRVFKLPGKFAVTSLSAQASKEIPPPDGAGVNTQGRVTNKGMEGLALTPDGRTLVGAMQSPLIQDGGNHLVAGQFTRIITIDIETGRTHEYAYPLDTAVKTTISDILAVNDHEFLVDERDSKGRADVTGSVAKFKKLFRIDLRYAHDVSMVSGVTAGVPNIAPYAVPKTLFLDIVEVLTSDPVNMAATAIPAKLEGITFGPDVTMSDHSVKHTLWLGNDNDFLTPLPPGVGAGDNPNQFFVFAFDDHDLPFYEPQEFHGDEDEHHNGHDRFEGPFGHGFFGLFDGHHGFDWFK